MRILYVSYYKDKNDIRQLELEHCLKKNIQNPFIDKIVILLEGQIKDFPYLNTISKVQVIETPRPTFEVFFEIANVLSEPDDYSIIANTDIYFDESIGLLHNYSMHNMCFALSRYHFYEEWKIELHNEKFSQDVWIFQGKIKKMLYSSFHMGVPGCDNRIAYEIATAGYNIFNPAYSIKCIHYHRSELRNYHAGKIQKPYLPVPICHLPAPRNERNPIKTW